MYKHYLVLDACSLINLIYIDYDYEEIFEHLNEHTKFFISEKVMKEIRDNAFSRLDGMKKRGEVSESEYNKIYKFIDKKIGELWKNVEANRNIKQLVGADFFNKVHDLADYDAENGEFYSAALSLFKSRLEGCRLSFITDDRPAMNDFSEYYSHQKIGFIEDSADLFALLYWNCQDISSEKLQRFLIDLLHLYSKHIKLILNDIQGLFNKSTKSGDAFTVYLLSELDHKLRSYNIREALYIKKKILKSNYKYRKQLNSIFNQYDDLFDLNGDENLLNKIAQLLNNLNDIPIFRA